MQWTRTATDLPERGGALTTAFDVRGRVHTLAGQTHHEEVVTPASKLWQTLKGFLQEVLPVCEECGVSLALHPDDPPLANLHGKPQIVYDVEQIAKVPKLVPSPANGICFCAGTFASAGIDVPAAICTLGKAIKFVHSRNVVHEPVEGLPAGSVFRETWQDVRLPVSIRRHLWDPSHPCCPPRLPCLLNKRSVDRDLNPQNGDIDMYQAYAAYLDALGHASGVVVRPDHVPTLVGETNSAPGYHVLGRLFALGYLKGLMEAVEKGTSPPRVGIGSKL